MSGRHIEWLGPFANGRLGFYAPDPGILDSSLEPVQTEAIFEAEDGQRIDLSSPQDLIRIAKSADSTIYRELVANFRGVCIAINGAIGQPDTVLRTGSKSIRQWQMTQGLPVTSPPPLPDPVVHGQFLVFYTSIAFFEPIRRTERYCVRINLEDGSFVREQLSDAQLADLRASWIPPSIG